MNFGSIFASNQEPVEDRAYERFREEVMKVGGMLHFDVERSEAGWTASCRELEAIVTGGDETSPDTDLIEARIREVLQTAFDLPVKVKLDDVIQNVANPVFQLQGAF